MKNMVKIKLYWRCKIAEMFFENGKIIISLALFIGLCSIILLDFDKTMLFSQEIVNYTETLKQFTIYYIYLLIQFY